MFAWISGKVRHKANCHQNATYLVFCTVSPNCRLRVPGSAALRRCHSPLRWVTSTQRDGRLRAASGKRMAQKAQALEIRAQVTGAGVIEIADLRIRADLEQLGDNSWFPA